MLSTSRLSASSRSFNARSRSVAVRSVGAENGASSAFADGAKVRVTKAVKVYHVPKAPADGINLENMEGQLVKNCAHFKGKVLSPNLPYLVKFETKVNDAPVKFQAHLAEDELTAL